MVNALIWDVIANDKASKTMASISGAVDTQTDKMGKLSKAGELAGKALLVGFAAVGAGAVAATKAAAEDEQSQARLAQQLRNTTGATDGQVASVESWITAQGKALGVSDDELRPALASLATATGSVAEAQDLASLAMDVAAGRGKSLQSVSDALAKAQNGNLGGLAKLGVATKDAAGNTLSLSQITGDLAAKYKGDAAAAADTAAGKQQILAVQMQELKEQIGTGLLPIMSALAAEGLKMAGWVADNTGKVEVFVGVVGALLATVWAVSAATKVWEAVQLLAGVATTAWSGAQWLLNAAMDANPIGLLVLAIAALVAGIIIAYKHSETFRAIVDAAFHGIVTVVTTAVSWVVDFVRDHWLLLVTLIGGPIALAVVEVIKHWDDIKRVTGAAWDWVRDKVDTGVHAVLAVIRGIEVAPVVVRAAFDLVERGVGSVMNSVHDSVSRLWGGVTKIITGGADDIVEAVRGIPGRLAGLADKFASTGSAIIGAFVNGLKGAGGLVSDIAGNVWDAVRGLLNNAIDRVNAALSFSINLPGPLGSIAVNPPDIPHLAAGGIVTQPTLALIGEAGPEAVIPLSGPRRPTVGVDGLPGGSGDGPVANLTVNLVAPDGRMIQQQLLKMKRLNGGLTLGLA